MDYEGEETGDARVDEAIAGLDRLGELPIDQHVAVFDDTHTTLRQVLSELDAGPDDGRGLDAGPDGGQGR
jgi:hypothetical protein